MNFDKTQHINILEDFDFNKVKQSDILDEYQIDPKLIRKANKDISFDLVFNKVFHINGKLKNLYPADTIDIINKVTDDYGKLKIIKTQFNNTLPFGIIGILETVGFKRYTIKPNDNDNLPYKDYIIDCLKKYCGIKDNLIHYIIIEYFISPDNGVIFVTHISILNYNNLYGIPEFPNILMYTGEVLYNKKMLLSMNEDFDFNKIKKHDIQDEYEINYVRIRNKISDLNLDPKDILYNLYNKYSIKKKYLKHKICKDPLVGTYYSNFTNLTELCIENVEEFWNAVFPNKLKKLGFTHYTYSCTPDGKLLNKFVSNIDSIPNWLYTIIEGLYDTAIDPLDEILKTNTINISYWLSPDKGIVIIECISLEKYNDKGHRYRVLGPTIAFTGLNMYLQTDDIIPKINEDFDFSSVKTNNILDEYKVSVREVISHNVPLKDVLLKNFNIKLPSSWKCYKKDVPGFGDIITSADNYGVSTIDEGSLLLIYGMSNQFKKTLLQAGFKEVKTHFPRLKAKPDLLFAYNAIRDLILEFRQDGRVNTSEEYDEYIEKTCHVPGESSILLELHLPITLYISPDNGIIFLDTLDYCITYPDGTYASHKQKFSYKMNCACFYSGEVIYKDIKKTDKKEISQLNKQVKLNKYLPKIIERMFINDDVKPWPNVSWLQYATTVDRFFLYNTVIYPIENGCGILPINKTPKITYLKSNILKNFFERPANFFNIIKDNVSANEVLYAFTDKYGKNKKWYMYCISDYNKVVKLVGNDIASKMEPFDFKFEDEDTNIKVYVIIYLTKYMMDLINDLVFGKDSYPTFVKYGRRTKDGLLEDFDFNKVKSKNISDEYEISPKNIRLANKNIPFENIYYNIFHKICPLLIDKATQGLYSDIILDYFGRIRITEPLDINGKIPNSLYYLYNQINSDLMHQLKTIGFTKHSFNLSKLKPDDFDNKYLKLVFDLVKETYNIDIAKCSKLLGYVRYVLSPDNGIMQITSCSVECNLNDRYIQKYLPVCMLYTGDVSYNEVNLDTNILKITNNIPKLAELFNINYLIPHHLNIRNTQVVNVFELENGDLCIPITAHPDFNGNGYIYDENIYDLKPDPVYNAISVLFPFINEYGKRWSQSDISKYLNYNNGKPQFDGRNIELIVNDIQHEDPLFTIYVLSNKSKVASIVGSNNIKEMVEQTLHICDDPIDTHLISYTVYPFFILHGELSNIMKQFIYDELPKDFNKKILNNL